MCQCPEIFGKIMHLLEKKHSQIEPSSELAKMHSEPHLLSTEAVIQRRSVKKVFLEISQNSQENTCAKVAFLIKLQA